MRPCWISLALLGVALPLGAAEDRKFPYQAVVDVDEEFVRCGPGPKFYPTDKLKRGTKVAVHRHDPGGWAMIAPPAGSFSWIQADYVQRGANGHGTLNENSIIVHVGSNLSDERGIYQRTLSRGDVVEILGEQSFETERGPVTMLKIKPPPREYRWIATKALLRNEAQPTKVPLPTGPPKPSSGSPIAVELEPNITQAEDPFAPSPFQTDEPATNSAKNALPSLGPALESVAAASPGTDRAKLDALDQKLREMVQQEPQSWDLASIEQGYREFDKQTAETPIRRHAQQKLKSLKKYAQIKQEYDEFYQLTTETKQRDAQLLTLQQQAAQLQGGIVPVDPPSAAAPNNVAVPAPRPESTPADPRSPAAPPKFAGAGIVSPVIVPGGSPPQWVLIAPDGRLLAHLQPAPGVDLNRWVNQSVGVTGQRSHNAELKSDVIVVRGLTPVRLRGQ